MLNVKVMVHHSQTSVAFGNVLKENSATFMQVEGKSALCARALLAKLVHSVVAGSVGTANAKTHHPMLLAGDVTGNAKRGHNVLIMHTNKWTQYYFLRGEKIISSRFTESCSCIFITVLPGSVWVLFLGLEHIQEKRLVNQIQDTIYVSKEPRKVSLLTT